MKIQTELIFSPSLTARDMHYGEVFFCKGYKDKSLMRVKPTGFLLNSTLIADVLNRGDCFVVNMESGTLYAIEGTKPVVVQKATLHIQET